MPDSLDALGGYFDVEALRHGDRRTHNALVTVVFFDIRNQRLVEDEAVDKAAVDGLERYVARAEVVERQPTPSFRKARSVSCSASRCCIISPSQISSSMQPGSSAVSASAFETTSTSRRCISCCGDKLMAIDRSGSSNRRCQAASCRHAVAMTHSPAECIRPLLSSMGRKRAGGNRPKRGCCQRNKASSPISRLS